MKTPRNINLRKRATQPHREIYGLLAIPAIPILALLVLSSSTYAESSGKTNVSVEVKQGCSVTARNNQHTGSISNGTHGEIGSPTEVNVACNGNNLYSVYAVGYSNDEEGNNNLIGLTNGNIATGSATEGSTSSWHFKLSTASDGLTIEPAYTTYTSIPNSSTLVAKRESSTTTTNDSFNATYAAYISKSQPADTYSGKVQYTLFDQGIPVATMQDFDCSTLESGASTELTDTRDGNTYTVAKLADGHCWMTDNLRLGDSKLTAKNPDRKLTSADSDVSADYTVPESSPSGFAGTNPDKVYVPDEESGNYKMEYGGYYTWVAATAGTGASIKTDYENAPSSICPKGWRLPKGSDKNDNTNEFALLMKAYDGTGGTEHSNAALLNKLISPALPGFVFSGYYSSSYVSSQGSCGIWWSSTSVVSYGGYYLRLDGSGYVTPLYGDDRSLGRSLRCIAR